MHLPAVSGSAIFLFILFSGYCGFSQSYWFSQYYAAPLFVNPANAGAEEDVFFGLNYRMQQLGGLSYKTGQFTAILPLYAQGQEKKHTGGVGLSLLSDLAGQSNEIHQMAASFCGAYNLHLDVYNSQMLTFGLQGEYRQINIDYLGLNWPSQISFNGFTNDVDPGVQFNDRTNFVTFNAGVMWTYDSDNKRRSLANNYKLNLGFSAANINEPDQSLLDGQTNPLSVLYKIHGGGEFELSDVVKIAPDFLVLMQNEDQVYNVGAIFSYTKYKENSGWEDVGLDMHVGTWYRLQDSFVFLLGAGNNIFNAAISYDVNAMQAKLNFRGQSSLELFLSYRIPTSKNVKQIGSPLK